MQIVPATLFASLAVAMSVNAMAESGAPSIPICTEAQVFGSEFGATAIQGKIVGSGLNSVVVELADSWAPFKVVEIGLTRRSKRIWGGSAFVTVADQQQARDLQAILRSRLEQTLSISDQQIDRLGGVTLYTGNQYFIAAESGGERYHTDGLEIKLSVNAAVSNSSLFVSCSDLKQQTQHVREVLAK